SSAKAATWTRRETTSTPTGTRSTTSDATSPRSWSRRPAAGQHQRRVVELEGIDRRRVTPVGRGTPVVGGARGAPAVRSPTQPSSVEGPVPKFLVAVKYSPEGVKGLLSAGGTARRAATQSAVEALGGTLESFHFAFGEDDAFVIVDMPDNESAA